MYVTCLVDLAEGKNLEPARFNLLEFICGLHRRCGMPTLKIAHNMRSYLDTRATIHANGSLFDSCTGQKSHAA